MSDAAETIIADGMVLVQQLTSKNYNIKSCSDLAKHYITNLEAKTRDYDKVHLIFDHYDISSSLLFDTREQRKGAAKST